MIMINYEGFWDTDSGQPQYNTQHTTGFGCGAGVLYQKKFFEEVGGFDPYYFYSIEEQDLGLRVWICGHKVLYVPSAVMHHYMGQTGFRNRGVTPAIEFLQARNKLHFIFKNFEVVTVIKGFCLFVIHSFYKIIYAAGHGNFNVPAAIIKGYFFFFKDIAKTLSARRDCQKTRKQKDKSLLKQGALVGVLESTRRLRVSREWMRQRRRGPLYDNKDSVSVRIDQDGEMTFYKPT